ncbi:MAG: transporter [Methyloceanibacter sp.]
MRERVRALACTAAILGLLAIGDAEAAEFGTGPWVKGYTDIFGGIVPPQPGFYFRTDAYHYNGDAGATIFDGLVQLGVDQDYTATIAALTYVTPWKILGGTYAVAVAPSVVAMNVDVGLSVPRLTGPLGMQTVGPFAFEIGDTNLDFGDTAFAPLVLGWNAGKFHWNVAVFGFAPTGDYSTRQLANTSLNHWAIMPRFAATYFDLATGWQATGAVVYSFNFENPATDYESGDILNLEGAITKNFGPLGVGAVGYAMIQTTGDSGSGAKLGSFESRVYGAGPIVTYMLGDPRNPLTFIAKYYQEFDAENTFEGRTFDVAVTARF